MKTNTFAGLAVAGVVTFGFAAEAVATEWNVSLWGKRRAFTEHVEKLAELVHTALTVPNPKTRYAAVKGRFMEKAVMRMAAPRALDALIAKRLGITRQES